jgi:predicted ATP-binding protein involved in virulence
MKIRRIQLYRFRGFEDLQIIFPTDAKLLVFIGENGSGKTSFMEGIAMILQDTLYKHHRYDKVNWQSPQNVNTNHEYGSIAIGLQGAKRSYDFSQTLSAKRMRFVSEDKLTLEKNRDLTEEEKIEHYKAQAKIAYKTNSYEKALEYWLKLTYIQEKLFSLDNADLALTYRNIGMCYSGLKKYDEALIYANRAMTIQEKLLNYDNILLADTYNDIALYYNRLSNELKSIEYYQKALIIQESILDSNDIDLARSYNNIGTFYYLSENSLKTLENSLKALEYFQKALHIYEKILPIQDSELWFAYECLRLTHNKLGNNQESNYYAEKIKRFNDNIERKPNTPELYLTNDKDQLKHLNEYLEAELPLVLQYNAKQGSIENYKDALPIAFAIPMTTNFDMVSDWFTEYENEENRKRLRVNMDYRSEELETVRKVIKEGLILLNDSTKSIFKDLQTEIDETVEEGQFSSWLSIKKNDVFLHVNQLSDGEKRVLILLIDISRRLINLAKINKVTNYLEGRGIVLIDEIEQHLHPKWQRTLLPTLSKLFPNLQFVVTTHSPQVLSYVPNGCAFTLENGKAYPKNTYGKNNEWILEAIMDDINRPKEIQEELNQYFDLIREGNLEDAAKLRQKLENLIGADEPEFLKADILIRRKQKNVISNETNS